MTAQRVREFPFSPGEDLDGGAGGKLNACCALPSLEVCLLVDSDFPLAEIYERVMRGVPGVSRLPFHFP